MFKHKTLSLRVEDFFITHVSYIIRQMNWIAPSYLINYIDKISEKYSNSKIIEVLHENNRVQYAINNESIEN